MSALTGDSPGHTAPETTSIPAALHREAASNEWIRRRFHLNQPVRVSPKYDLCFSEHHLTPSENKEDFFFVFLILLEALAPVVLWKPAVFDVSPRLRLIHSDFCSAARVF